MNENNNLFREKSMERLASPEQLNDYLRVTNPSTWIVMTSVIILLVSLILWSSFAVIESYVSGTGKAENGVLSITFEDQKAAGIVEEGMTVSVGEVRTVVTSVGRDEQGQIIAAANAGVPDGIYDVKVLVPEGISVSTAEAYRGIIPRYSTDGGTTAPTTVSLRSTPPLASLRSAPVPPLTVPRVAWVSPSRLAASASLVPIW